MRTTGHSEREETQFERKPRMELISYFNLPSNVVSARPETLQIYSFASKDEDYDQLVMKKPRKLKCDVTIVTIFHTISQ